MRIFRLLLIFFGCFLLLIQSLVAAQSDATPLPRLDAWNLYDPHDADRNSLLVATDDGLHVDTTWQVESIEYLYQWWGLGKPVFDYQKIEHTINGFQKAGESVAAEQVEALVAAITGLSRTQFLLAGNSHTDDYPSWAVEITGVDGQRMQLFSSSNGNPGSVPWNVMYNGRMYVQYDGSLVGPLASLFSTIRGEPAGAFFPGGQEPGTINFATSGLPRQLTQGFSGLLPIADGFQYGVDANEHKLNGTIEGRSSIIGIGNMVIGVITGLTSVQITADSTINCDIQTLPTNDVAGAAWTFSCDMPPVANGEAYNYPIQVMFKTDKGEDFTTSGALQGIWGDPADTLLLPIDEGVLAALLANPDAKDLLTDHIAAYAVYQASMKQEDADQNIMSGEVILLGQTLMAGQTIRYTIGTPFIIRDGKLTRWDLNRNDVDEMLGSIGATALMGRAIQADNRLILNLWLAEKGDSPEELRYLMSASSRDYSVQLKACGDEPAQDLPDVLLPDGQALRAFSLNDSWAFNSPNFVLLDGKVRVDYLNLWSDDNANKLFSALLPESLQTGEHPPFKRIIGDSNYFQGQPELRFYLPENASEADIQAYREIAASLGGEVDVSYDSFWTVNDVAFRLNEAGELQVVDCSA